MPGLAVQPAMACQRCRVLRDCLLAVLLLRLGRRDLRASGSGAAVMMLPAAWQQQQQGMAMDQGPQPVRLLLWQQRGCQCLLLLLAVPPAGLAD